MVLTKVQWKAKLLNKHKNGYGNVAISFFIMSRKLNKDENFLELIPVRNPALEYSVDDNGIVIITVPNIGFFNKLAQTFFKRPKISYIHLDAYSSYVWRGMNGKRDLTELGRYLKRKYGDNAEPLYERLIEFINILKSNKYIGLIDKEGVHIK